jgi:hypothetical protein
MSDNLYKLEAEQTNILDKSFILNNSKSKEIEESSNQFIISEEPSGNIYLINKSIDSEDMSSICNLISNNTGKIDDDSCPTSNELNIYDSFESKYKQKQYYFRNVTKTSNDIPIEENKKLIDNILMFYKGNDLGLIEFINNGW